jgi:hypothetical protein
MSEARIVLAVFLDEAEALATAAKGTAAEKVVAGFRDAALAAYLDAKMEVGARLS